MARRRRGVFSAPELRYSAAQGGRDDLLRLGLHLGYSGLYIVAAGVSVLGSVLVTRIRSLD